MPLAIQAMFAMPLPKQSVCLILMKWNPNNIAGLFKDQANGLGVAAVATLNHKNCNLRQNVSPTGYTGNKYFREVPPPISIGSSLD